MVKVVPSNKSVDQHNNKMDNPEEYLVEVDGECDRYYPSESDLDVDYSSSATEERSDYLEDDFHDDPDLNNYVNDGPDLQKEPDPPTKGGVSSSTRARKRKRQPEIEIDPVVTKAKKRKKNKPRANLASRLDKEKKKNVQRTEKKRTLSSHANVSIYRTPIQRLRVSVLVLYGGHVRGRGAAMDTILHEQPTSGRHAKRSITAGRIVESEDFAAVPVILPEIRAENSQDVVIGPAHKGVEFLQYRDLEEVSPEYRQIRGYCETCGSDHTENWSHDYLCHDLRKLSSKWRCKRCERTFVSVMAFTKHSPCQSGSFSCPVCCHVSPDLLSVFQHALMCLEQKSISNYQWRLDAAYVVSLFQCMDKSWKLVAYRCRHCPRSFTTTTEAAEHSIVHDTSPSRLGGEHTCKYCDFTFTNARACSVHESLHPDLQCPSCAVRFLNIDLLQKHISKCSVIKEIPATHQNCGFCGLSGRGSHMSTSLIERKCENAHPVTKLCRTCGKVCKSQTKLGEHLRKAHRDPVNTFCERCNKWFPTRHLLMVHRTHRCYKVRPRRFACRFCGVRFASRIGLCCHQLKSHDHKSNKNMVEKTHFQCRICLKSFNKRHQLSLHTRLAHAGIVHECSTCGLKFMSRDLLTAHQRVYHAALLFQCNICQRRIRSRIGLDQHLVNIHFQRFKCKLCDVTFEFDQDFEHHLQLFHKKEDMCEKCGEKRHGRQRCVKSSLYNRLSRLKWTTNAMKPLRLRLYLECLVCRQPFSGNGLLHTYESHWDQHVLGNGTTSRCPVCVYDTSEGHADIFMHMMVEHPNHFHKCPKCLLHFTNLKTLEFHSKYCHFTPCWQLSTIEVMNSFLKCLECDLLFINTLEAAKHATNHSKVKHAEGILSCPRCLKLWPRDSRNRGLMGSKYIYDHIGGCRYNVSVSCRLCTEVSTPCSFFSHMSSQHGVVMVNDHQSDSKRNKTCPHCGQEERNLQGLERHLFRRHRDKLDPNSRLVSLCSKCGKEVYYLQIKNHLQTCSVERKFQCDKCDAKFKFKHHLQNHAKTHEAKRFECKPCEMKFRLRHHLESHQRSFHGREGYKCRDCGKEFKLRWKRTKHERDNHGKTIDESD